MRRPRADREEKRVTHGRDDPTVLRYVTEIQAMPRGRRPQGEHALSNAERQARYRARQLAPPFPTVTRTHSTIGRRSRPQRWRDAVAELLALQADYADWLRRSPTACATAPQPTRSKRSPTSIWEPSPTSSRQEATAATDICSHPDETA